MHFLTVMVVSRPDAAERGDEMTVHPSDELIAIDKPQVAEVVTCDELAARDREAAERRDAV
jgi:hypothetical protein